MFIKKKIIYLISIVLVLSIWLNFYLITQSQDDEHYILGTYVIEDKNPFNNTYFAFREDGMYEIYTPQKILFNGQLHNIDLKKNNIFHIKDEQVDFYIVFMGKDIYALGFKGGKYPLKKISSVYSVIRTAEP